MPVPYMSICPKCASFKMNSVCKYCNIQRVKTDTSFEESMKLTDKQEEDLINHYIETLIKDTYDPKAREERETNEKHPFDGYVSDDRVTCPYCKSYNTSKITVVNKAVHTSIFGIWSMGRNAKNYHCNNCGSDF